MTNYLKALTMELTALAGPAASPTYTTWSPTTWWHSR